MHMRSHKKHLATLMSAIVLFMLIGGCSASTQVNTNDQAAFTWKISVSSAQIKSKLHTDAGATRYDGTVASIAYDDAPKAGNKYLLVEMTIKKNKPGGDAFVWEKLSIKSAKDITYERMDNDSFLESHNYLRMPGTDLMLGENTGWICIEIPASAAKEKFFLVYRSSEGEMTIALKPELF